MLEVQRIEKLQPGKTKITRGWKALRRPCRSSKEKSGRRSLGRGAKRFRN